MTSTLFVPILATGFAVAFLHTVIPTHWLPFALVGRAQGWSRTKTLLVAAFAALGHVFTTLVLGALLTGMGLWIEHRFGRLTLWIGVVLIGVGLYHLVRYIRLRRGGVAAEEARAEHKVRRVYASDVAAIVALFSIVALSPGETFCRSTGGHPVVGRFRPLEPIARGRHIIGMVCSRLFLAPRSCRAMLERHEAACWPLCSVGIAVMVIPD